MDKTTTVTIYLTKEGTTLDNAIAAKKTQVAAGDNAPTPYKLVEKLDDVDLDFEARCYVKAEKAKPAAWLSWMDSTFDFSADEPKNASSGAVIVVQIGNRVFAATFGTGRFALDQTKVVPDFGLKVAVNTVKTDQIQSLVSLSLELETKEKQVHHHSGGQVGSFDLNLDTDWVRRVAGRAPAGSDYATVTGAEGVQLRGYTRELPELDTLCTDLLTAYEAKVSETFDFINNITALKTSDPNHKLLEDALAARLDAGNFDGAAVIVAAADFGRFSTGRVFYGKGHEAEIGDLGSDTIKAAVETVKLSVDKAIAAGKKNVSQFGRSRVTIELQDEGGNEVGKYKLIDVINAEDDATVPGKTHIRIDRKWVEVSADYLKSVNDRVARLIVATPPVTLSKWDKATHDTELEYNKSLTDKNNDWFLQDQVFVKYTGNGKIEPCDILTRDGCFIHVKKGTSSACLSHLAAQMVTSADLYRNHDDTRDEINQRYAGAFPGDSLGDQKLTVVAAVGRPDPTKHLLGKMLIAKIQVLEAARRIRALEYDFVLVGFEAV